MNEQDQQRRAGIGFLVAFLIGALIKLGVLVRQLARGGWNLDAPVTLRTLLYLTAAEVFVFAYLLLKVIWWGTPGVFS